MYSFREVDHFIVNQFNNKHEKGHILQTEFWASVKKEWTANYIGGYDQSDTLVLTCTLLLRKMPLLNQWIAYIPRGFTCDYMNENLMISFIRYLREYAKKTKIAFIAMDPDIHLSENKSPVEYGQKVRDILLRSGFSVRAAQNFENIQPTYVFRLKLPEGIPPSEAKKLIFDCFNDKTRYNIRVAMRRGLTVEKYDGKEVNDALLDQFQKLMNITGARDRFVTRQKPYFASLLKDLYPHCRLYLVKYSPARDAEGIQSSIQQREAELEKLRDTERGLKRIEELEREIKRLKERLDEIKPFAGSGDIYLSGAIYLKYNKKAWYLYGASANEFRETMPNYLMQWQMIQDSMDDGCTLYDFRGVSGNMDPEHPLYGLHKFKKGFGGDFVQFIGEFHLVIDKTICFTYRNIFPVYKKIYRILTRGCSAWRKCLIKK